MGVIINKVRRRRGFFFGKYGMLVPAVLFMVPVLVILFWPVQAHAAFPDDIEKKNVIAEALDSGDVMIFRDSSREDFIETVPGEGFKIRIRRVKGDSLYGNYKCGDLRGEGWIPMDAVVWDPDFAHVYATVRAGMTIYTDASCSEKKNRIRKYSGVILIGKEGDSRQVIYDKGDRYGIGWMKREEYANNLKYDGRPKQTLADGIYYFQCGYQDDAYGGKADQSGMNQYQGRFFRIRHVENDAYTLCDPKTGKYLAVKGNPVRGKWLPVWKNKEDIAFGRFVLKRIGGSFSIMSTVTRTYYACNRQGKGLLVNNTKAARSHWRPTATGRMGDEEKPFVFTQYDPQWCATAYGSEGCMGTAGCGILAPVNAVYALSGQYMDVMELADYAVEKDYRIEGSGTADGVFKGIARTFGRKYGFVWDGTGTKIKTLKKKLKEGKVAVSHVEGHYVCFCAYDEKKDKYLLLDSNCLPKRKDTPFGDWIGPERLREGTLASQGYFFYRLRGQ